jgi:imidazolonepropionase-like amidohydrolase
MRLRTLLISLSLAAACPAADLALVGARIYPAPGAAPIPDGVVLIRGAKIVSVGPRAGVAIPPDAEKLDGRGLSLLAGFWNSHIHLTEPKWDNAARKPREVLESQLRDMLVRYGFTTAFDVGSYPVNTLALRRRIESGEVAGPRILTCGGSIPPAGGSPYYLLPLKLPEATTPERGVMLARYGPDAVKIFTVSWAARGKPVAMPLETVRAITEDAHRRGKLVFAHPSTLEGVGLAVSGGVDIVAHTASADVPDAVLRRMKDRDMTLIPTLALFEGQPRNLAQVREFSKLGGRLLFGTDLGYLTDYTSTGAEFTYLAKAGLSFDRILAMLTTAPAARFGAAAHSGKVAPDMDADLVLLDGDPAQAAAAFTAVKYAIRQGRVIYR